MRRNYRQHTEMIAMDDADIAAGLFPDASNNNNNNKRNVDGSSTISTGPPSLATINTAAGTDLEFFEDLVSEPVLVLGMDISHLPRQTQFAVCAVGVFGFSLLYGYLQELIAVELCNRKLGLFQAMMQFTGYTVLAYVLNQFVDRKQKKNKQQRLKDKQQQQQQQKSLAVATSTDSLSALSTESDIEESASSSLSLSNSAAKVPLQLYLGLSLLRALDLAMTNLAMQYINYPAKTLMKSSRVVFTMMFGVVISRKVYHAADYLIVLCMVAGLAIFMHADANSSAVFSSTGVIMLTVSLLCDGAISNVSETIMSKFGVGQDEVSLSYFCVCVRVCVEKSVSYYSVSCDVSSFSCCDFNNYTF